MKVSVIIPTFNGEKTISRAIESILNQTSNVEVEILICDDCSTDRTVHICRGYGCTILLSEQNTGGPNAGRNRGIKYAKSELIAFLDQDDEWLPNKLELQLKQIKNGAELVYSQRIKKVG